MISQLSEVEVAIALHLLKQNLRGKYLDEALKRASPGKIQTLHLSFVHVSP